MTHVIDLSVAGERPRSVVGGKAQSLGHLIREGFPVPPGFVITTGATGGPDPQAWPAGLREAVTAAYRALTLAGERVAVRSSASDEDGAGASFAGQYLTVLDVATMEDLWAAIARCIASAASESARAYRDERASGGDAPMAVVVQRMVAAELSGVAFSVDPVTGDAGRTIVEAVAGAGEALVSGTTEADRFVLERPSFAIISRHHAAHPVLTDTIAHAAAVAAVHAESAFGAPQDIEFCYAGETLWLLQSRPVTASGGQEPPTEGEFDTPTGPDDLWTSANVQEVLPGLLTPLTMSVFSEVAHVAYSQGYQQLRILNRDEWPSFVGLFYNRAYLNVGAMRLIADRVIGGDGDMVEHRFLGGPPTRKRWRNPFRNLRYKTRSAIPLVRMTVGIHKAADRIERATMAQERRIRGLNLQALSDTELEHARRGLVNFGASIFTVHLQATGCAGSGFDAIAKAVTPLLKGETEGTLPALFTGLANVESARIGLDLWELSRIALQESLAADIRTGTFDPHDPHLPEKWRQAFAAFLERHGHRGLNEMEPAAKNWRADAAPVAQVVRAYLDLPEGQAPPATFARQQEERLKLTAQIAGRMWGPRRRMFLFMLNQAQGWVALRERTKSIVVRSMRVVDYLAPEIQGRLIERGVIDEPGDLFFLSSDELSEYLLGRRGPDLRTRAMRRRREYERNRHIQLPERFSGRPEPQPLDLTHIAGDVLSGTPVSPGIVTGRARVILDPATDGPMQPGEILVAPVTDAGWTPLFALASGLVVDIGSALSHGSTVAREYGLPAVVNVRRGTRSIRTGDLVTVNGTAGTVTVVEQQAAPRAT